MAEAFYIGAYWGPRAESVEECAARLSGQLHALTGIHPLLGSWFKKGKSRKAALAQECDPSPESLREILLAGQQRRDDAARSVMAELGYSASLWNGQQVQVELSVRCGSGAAIPGMASNNVSIQLPSADDDGSALYQREAALAIVRSVVTAWAPVWCSWTSHRLRMAQESQAGDIVAGWATYVADSSSARVDRLPAGLAAEPVGTGVLVVADGTADSVSEATVFAVRAALGPATRSAS